MCLSRNRVLHIPLNAGADYRSEFTDQNLCVARSFNVYLQVFLSTKLNGSLLILHPQLPEPNIDQVYMVAWTKMDFSLRPLLIWIPQQNSVEYSTLRYITFPNYTFARLMKYCSAIEWSRSVNWRDPKDFQIILCLRLLDRML